MFGFLKKIFGDNNEKEIKRMMEYVDKIAETKTHSLTDMGMDDVPVQNQIIKTIVIK